MSHNFPALSAPELIFVPFLTRARFAALVGITDDVLERWIRDGRIRTYRIGKRSLVDMRQWMSDMHAADQKPESGEQSQSRSPRSRRVAPAAEAEQ